MSSLISVSDDGADGVVVGLLDVVDQSTEPTDESELNLEPFDCRESDCELEEFNDASEFDLKDSDMLGGLPLINEDLRLDEGESKSRKLDFWPSSDRGRRNEMVLDLRSARFSTSSSGVGSFFSGSGSLYSNFPLLSEAKNSLPRPKTTCKLAKSRTSDWANRKSLRSGGRSWLSLQVSGSVPGNKDEVYVPCRYAPPLVFQQT